VIAHVQALDPRANFDNRAGAFVTHYHWHAPIPIPLANVEVTSADASAGDLDPYLPCPGGIEIDFG
jgi:hypothetical protein